MKQEDINRITDHILTYVTADSRRQFIIRIAKLTGKWIAILAVISAVVSFVLDGWDFINKKIPTVTSFASKQILLRATFRPVLVERVIREDLAYSNLCTGSVIVMDLDNDGQATDLLIEMYPREADSTCEEDRSGGSYSSYAVLKEVD